MFLILEVKLRWLQENNTLVQVTKRLGRGTTQKVPSVKFSHPNYHGMILANQKAMILRFGQKPYYPLCLNNKTMVMDNEYVSQDGTLNMVYCISL